MCVAGGKNKMLQEVPHCEATLYWTSVHGGIPRKTSAIRISDMFQAKTESN
jgi:hypothetical protein